MSLAEGGPASDAAPPTDALLQQRPLIVAVDIDEVICRFSEGFMRWWSNIHDDPLVPSQCFRACYSAVARSARPKFLLTQAFLELEPVPGALEALSKLRSLGFELQAVTSRPAETRETTNQYLAKFFPGIFSDLHFVQSPHKGIVCSNIGAFVLVDDQPCNLSDALEHGVQAIVFDFDGLYSWNHGQEPSSRDGKRSAIRKCSWEAVLEWIVDVSARLQHSGSGLPRPLTEEYAVSGLRLPSAALEKREQASEQPRKSAMVMQKDEEDTGKAFFSESDSSSNSEGYFNHRNAARHDVVVHQDNLGTSSPGSEAESARAAGDPRLVSLEVVCAPSN